MNITNNARLPAEMFEVLSINEYELKDNKNPKLFSATTLTRPAKIYFLERRHWDELEKDIIDNFKMLLGTAWHAMCTKIDSTNRMIEERLYQNLGDYIISGQIDLFDITNSRIIDIKTTSAWTIVFQPKGRKEWEYQTNIYAWLLRKAGIKVDSIVIDAWFIEWKQKEADNSSDYPQHEAIVLGIPLWSLEAQEKYILERIGELTKHEDTPDDDIPACTPEERWQKNTQYAIMKNDNKRAMRVYQNDKLTNEENKADAEICLKGMQESYPKEKFSIVERPGLDVRCNDNKWCKVRKFCNYWKEHYEKEGKDEYQSNQN